MKADQSRYQQTALPLFSMEQINRIGNNDKEFELRMLSKFGQQVAECSGRIKNAIENESWVELKAVAHKNIPAYSIMQSIEVLELLRYIERNADKLEEQDRVKKFAALVCMRNDNLLFSIIDHIEVIKRPAWRHQFQFNEHE